MFGLSAHQNLIGLTRHPHFGITRQTFPQGHIGIQLRTRLIKQGWQKVGAVLHRARIRRLFPHQHVQHGGFPHTIWPDKGDAVPPLNFDRKGF